MVVILAIIVDITWVTTTWQRGPRRHDTETISDVSSRVREDAMMLSHQPRDMHLRPAFGLAISGVIFELQVSPAQTLKKGRKEKNPCALLFTHLYIKLSIRLVTSLCLKQLPGPFTSFTRACVFFSSYLLL